mmetsp:Transcript_48687/g.121885  ORF Transcript_48687/g.121885 Transcript_48687/m.121885 type:complete len:202 (+) Transcript_48687:1661-2266(+)
MATGESSSPPPPPCCDAAVGVGVWWGASGGMKEDELEGCDDAAAASSNMGGQGGGGGKPLHTSMSCCKPAAASPPPLSEDALPGEGTAGTTGCCCCGCGCGGGGGGGCTTLPVCASTSSRCLAASAPAGCPKITHRYSPLHWLPPMACDGMTVDVSVSILLSATASPRSSAAAKRSNTRGTSGCALRKENELVRNSYTKLL